MKIGLFTYVHLDEQELLDFNLVYHYIQHYINLGISPKHITILPYGYLNYEKNYERFKSICSYYNVTVYPIENFSYDFMTAHNRFLQWQKSDGIKFDWLVKTDIDEFMSYGYYNIVEYIYFLNKNNYECASGYMVDCLDINHTLKNVDKNTDIFLQFPKRLFLTKKAVKGYNYKIVTFKPNRIVDLGHHSCIDGCMKIHYQTMNRVYHFKWLYNLKQRLENNKKRKIFENYTWSNEEISNTLSIVVGDKIII
jgi:hypothetical protein